MNDMDAEELELPSGVRHARRSNGMRIVLQYEVNYDGWIVRFDTLFQGNQYNIAYRLPDEIEEGALQKIAEALIPVALKAWVDQQWARGRMIWFANDSRL